MVRKSSRLISKRQNLVKDCTSALNGKSSQNKIVEREIEPSDESSNSDVVKRRTIPDGSQNLFSCDNSSSDISDTCVSLDSSKESYIQNFSKTTPKKHKSNKDSQDSEENIQCTPPKQKKLNSFHYAEVRDENQIIHTNTTVTNTPSSLFSKLTLNVSEKLEGTTSSRKSLWPVGDIYQNAKKALHSTTPVFMPGRQKEIEELQSFLREHLKENTSGSLYISGPPGTGKTASLSLILNEKDVEQNFKKVYVNCTSIKSAGAVFSRIIKELSLKGTAKTEKDYLGIIEKYFLKSKRMNLLVLDEMDQLESKNQSILYTIFEWPAKFKHNVVLIGIANALDLTDRILPRLQARCELKPKLLHFAPYSKQQILEIITSRLELVDALKVFSPSALQMLAGKVAAVSGDVRRALDIARRVIEMIEKDSKEMVLQSIENVHHDQIENDIKKVDLKEVVGVLNKIYGTTQNLSDECDSSFPLQQKIVICSLLLSLKKFKNNEVTIGKLHDIYKKICLKRNLFSVDQAEFISLCSLIETKGILRVCGRKEPRLHKVNLEWDQEEVIDAIKDKVLISSILQDDSIISKF